MWKLHSVHIAYIRTYMYIYYIYIYYIIYLCISPRESHIKISTVYSVQCLHSSRFRARWRDVFPSLWEICLARKGYHTSTTAKNAWRVCPPHSFQAPKCEDYTTGYVWQLFLCGWCCCWQLNDATCPPWRNIWTEKNPGDICCWGCRYNFGLSELWTRLGRESQFLKRSAESSPTAYLPATS